MRTTIQSATAVFIVLASLITPAHGQDTLGDFWDKLQEDVEKVFDKATGEPEAQEPAQTETAPQSEAPVGDDQQYIQKAMHYSLESTNWGDRTTWKNPNTGHHGFVVPLGSGGTQGGQPCKAYMRTINTASLVTHLQGTACRQASGQWIIGHENVTAQLPPAQATLITDPNYGGSTTYSPTQTTTPSMPVYRDRATVTEVQRRLTDLGYNPGPVDGALGGKTSMAIQLYQRDQGLPEDGQITDALLAQLRAGAMQSVGAEGVAQQPSETVATGQMTLDPTLGSSELPTEAVASSSMQSVLPAEHCTFPEHEADYCGPSSLTLLSTLLAPDELLGPFT